MRMGVERPDVGGCVLQKGKDLSFKIISTGWQCRPFIERTLKSIEEQTVEDYEVRIVVDPSKTNETEEFAREWCDARDGRWTCEFPETQRFSTPNQLSALEYLDPDDDDIVVWLDLDGDQFAHAEVLAHLLGYYSDDTLLTYGSFKCVPKVATNSPAKAFPPEVIKSNGFRQHVRDVYCCFNHLRTMKGRIVSSIPANQFRWRSGPQKGQIYQGGADYIFTVAGLELAGPRHKFIEEVLMFYNHANPFADYKVRSHLSSPVVADFLRRPPLSPLKE